MKHARSLFLNYAPRESKKVEEEQINYWYYKHNKLNEATVEGI